MCKFYRLFSRGPVSVTPPSASDRWIEERLEKIAEQGRLRSLHSYPRGGVRMQIDGRSYLHFSGNDYRSLAQRPAVIAAAQRAAAELGTGASAARLVTGGLHIHDALEGKLATWTGQEAALLCGSGYLANLALLSAVVARGDLVIADRLVHGSIVDGLLLTRARIHRYRHNDLNHAADLLRRGVAKLRAGERAVIITESVFSMDGDLAPLEELYALALEHDAVLIVDEAHALGVFGPAGAGRVAAELSGCERVICTGTLSKALASYGGFVAGPKMLRELIANVARPFMLNTSLPPPAVGAALAALEEIAVDRNGGAELLERAELFRGELTEAGFDVGASASHVIPVLLGDAHVAARAADALRERGFIVAGIRPPTVPPGSARLRISLTQGHTLADLSALRDALVQCRNEGWALRES